jgi:hypothetical protein
MPSVHIWLSTDAIYGVHCAIYFDYWLRREIPQLALRTSTVQVIFC